MMRGQVLLRSAPGPRTYLPWLRERPAEEQAEAVGLVEVEHRAGNQPMLSHLKFVEQYDLKLEDLKNC